jgi:hypothetical protein
MAKAKSTGGGGSSKSNGAKGPIGKSSQPIKSGKSNGTLGPIVKKSDSNKVQMMQRAQKLKNAKPTDIVKPSSKGKGKGPGPGGAELPAKAPIIVYEYIYNEDTGESTPSVVMVPERDVVNLATEDIDAATITNLLFENIGANELVKFVRNDTIEGLNPYYNIISNLSDIRRRFNPSDLISEQITDIDSEGYSINIDNKIPDQEYLDAQGITDYVYIDEATGDLVVHVVNMKDSETVEVQIDTNGTIYEVNN